MNYYISCVLLLVASRLFAQSTDTLYPGSPLIRYDVLANSNRLYTMAFHNAEDSVVSSFQIRRSVVATNDRLLFVQQFLFPQGTITDSSVARKSDMQPVYMSMTAPDGQALMHLDFSSGNVRAINRRVQPATDTLHVMHTRYFDSNVMDNLIGAIRYRKGGRYLVYFYTFEKGGNDAYLLTCTGLEKRMINGKRIKTYRVHLKSMDSGSAFAFQSDYWIACSSGTIVLQEFAAGKGGKTNITLTDNQ